MKMTSTTDTENSGENIAKEFLIKKNYKILNSKWISNHKEIDIIAIDKDVLVIIEVKTRHSNCLIEPEVSVNRTKQRNLVYAAENYVNRFDINMEVRFDIISIIINDNGEHIINHIEDAFYPTQIRNK